MFIPETILQCDLAILSYHLYHQSVIWPLDPWYDVMTRSMSDRRTLFMNQVHEQCNSFDKEEGFRGPSSASFSGRSSNKSLDPVITQYSQLNPRLPAFTGTADGYVSIQTPAYITDKIKTVEVAQYKVAPNVSGDPGSSQVEIREICDYPDGTDHLIGFEGGHGLIASTTEPAWSLMGYVLMRKDPKNPDVHDIHIAFRGSRSGGSIARTVVQALGSHGNPDWVTDMANYKVENNWISKVGTVGKGFSYALQTCFGTVHHALKRLDRIYGTPRKITVTGHSLGAALASQMALAMTNGSFSAYLVRDLPAWPWNSLRYVGWAQPTCGSKDFSTNWALWVNGCFYWVKGDSVVTIGEGSSKGVAMASQHGGQSVMFEKPVGASENPHEIFLARGALLTQLGRAGAFLDSRLSAVTPWAVYNTFFDLVEGNAKSYKFPGASSPNHITQQNIRSVLNNYRATKNFEHFFGILSTVALNPNAYKKPKLFQSEKERQVKSVQARKTAGALRAVGWGGGAMSMQEMKTKVLDDLVDEITLADTIQGSNTAKYLGLALAVNAFSRSNLSWNELKSRPLILKCLKS
ncbi:MAG: hypothetical protein Q7U18_02880 [Methylobacter sp.]|nr:hypothetical protein [Methylobacter sp.]